MECVLATNKDKEDFIEEWNLYFHQHVPYTMEDMHDCACYVFKDNGIVAGYVCCEDYEREDNTIWISDVIVKENMRKKGYGKQMLKMIFDIYKGSKFILDVHHSNSVAVNLYKKLGFTITGYEMMKEVK